MHTYASGMLREAICRKHGTCPVEVGLTRGGTARTRKHCSSVPLAGAKAMHSLNRWGKPNWDLEGAPLDTHVTQLSGNLDTPSTPTRQEQRGWCRAIVTTRRWLCDHHRKTPAHAGRGEGSPHQWSGAATSSLSALAASPQRCQEHAVRWVHSPKTQTSGRAR